jgi:hypothetical protein
MIDAHAAGSLPLMVQSGTTHQQPMQRWDSLGVDWNGRGAENDGLMFRLRQSHGAMKARKRISSL